MIKIILVCLLTTLNMPPDGEQSVSSAAYLSSLPDAYPPFAKSDPSWADSMLAQMTVEEKIGQLFMIAAYSDRDKHHYDLIQYYIENYHIGGLIFFQGDPVTQVELTERYQEAAKYPLLIGIDAEWGLGMRLDQTISYPRQLLLGAVWDDRLIYDMGREIGRQHRLMGIHVNFAPVVDVNNNPRNPVINDRSFGEDRDNVARKGIAYMRGLQDEHIIACAKHFPGHGDTDVDSHKDLPVIRHNRARLDSIEIYPFRKMIEQGVSSIMVAHLNIPALDSAVQTPSTLSVPIVRNLLRKELGFRGLIFTDAMNMKGVTKYFETGESSLRAFLAGNDVLLYPDDVKAAVNQMKTAYSKGMYSEADLDRSVRKILLAKYWAGLADRDTLRTEGLVDSLNTDAAKDLRRQLVEAAITVVRDTAGWIPFPEAEKLKIATVTIGAAAATPFTRMIDRYVNADHFYLPAAAPKERFDALLVKLEGYDRVIADVQDMSRFASREFGVTEQAGAFAVQLRETGKALLVLFGSPYALEKFPDWQEIVVAYEAGDQAQELAAQVLFGGRQASGRLPVSAGGYRYGEGLITASPTRLRYGNVTELGHREAELGKLDSIIRATLAIKATPGCQVLVAKDGLVFFDRAYGYHTYDAPRRPVQTTDLYDIASITKIAATTPLLMKAVDEGRIDVDRTLGDYLDLPDDCNKNGLVLKDILTHQSGLQAWIPFYLETIDEQKKPKSDVYREHPDDDFAIMVCDDLYCSVVYQDSIWQRINDSELRNKKDYKYSDLGFYYFKEVVETVFGRPINELAEAYFWKPLGMNHTTYLPLESGFTKEEIVPTETEAVFRGRTIHGYVHDPGAAMMGGIGGHAGVFSTAEDLARLMQMLLNGGVYGGRRYLDSATIKYFTTAPFSGNRRGLGFDKPDPEGRWGSACASASLASFGHTGFTGTMAFADPENDLVFIFLSNRIHPTAENKKLIRENSRTQMHQAVYDIFSERMPSDSLSDP